MKFSSTRAPVSVQTPEGPEPGHSEPTFNCYPPIRQYAAVFCCNRATRADSKVIGIEIRRLHRCLTVSKRNNEHGMRALP